MKLCHPPGTRVWIVALAIHLSARLLTAGEFSTSVAPSPEDWRAVYGETTRTRYSTLAQIDPSNVAKLAQVWTFRDGDAADESTFWTSNPVVIRGKLYAVSPQNNLIALDAATGAELWRFTPSSNSASSGATAGRTLGVAARDNGGSVDLYLSAGGSLHQVAASTGKPVATFGSGGSIALPASASLNADATEPAAPPVVVGKSVIVTGGGVHAFDATSGASLWSFTSADIDAGRVVSADAGGRKLFVTLQTSGLLCLDASTGSEVWLQSIPGDAQIAPAAALFTLREKGAAVPAVVVSAANGRVFVFNRESGEPLAPDTAGMAVIPPEDANKTAGAPAVDPNNSVFLSAVGIALASVDVPSERVRWRAQLTRQVGGEAIVTGGNLVFRATRERFHAVDASTGVPLWEAEPGAASRGTPATYRVDGRQYVAVPVGDSIATYALPLDVIAKPVAVARPSERFDAEIARIEARLKADPPAPGGIVFLGSSTFTRWNVREAFPGLPVTNLGFGGSQIADINHYLDRLLPPLRPKLVVFYCGNNDVNANFSFDEVVGRYREFTAWMDANLPDTHVLLLSNLPTPRRWTIWPDLHVLNTLVAAEIAKHPRQHYYDGTHIMMDPDGWLRRDRISSDNLHMNATGNATMRDSLRPVIDTIWAKLQKP